MKKDELVNSLQKRDPLLANAVVEVIVLDLPEQSLWLMGT